jgi:hypothetical protein
MDKQQQNIDGLFRSKLENHRVKPSGLAWEKLDQQLSRQEKPAYPWWRVAAVAILLLSMGALLWTGSLVTEEIAMPVAQEQILPEELTEVAPETVEQIVEESIPAPTEPAELPKAAKPAAQKPAARPAELKQQTEEMRQTIAAIEVEPVVIAPTEIRLPEPQELYVAEVTEVRVRIVSNGIIEQPEKENLIDGIENKIEKVNNLFNKVDQGFADLQDAKNNLFATITSRKNRN